MASGRKPGAQPGHAGTTLKPLNDPDMVKDIRIDRRLLPPGQYKRCGHEARQVIDLDIATVVTEWRAKVVADEQGRRYVAPFPELHLNLQKTWRCCDRSLALALPGQMAVFHEWGCRCVFRTKTATVPIGKRPAFRLENGHHSGENGQYKLRV